MKILLDTCVWGGVREALRLAGCLHITELLEGALVTVEPGRIRIRPAENLDQ